MNQKAMRKISQLYVSYDLSTDKLMSSKGPYILVFGSNTQGRHGKGMALIAKDHWRAIYGQAAGPQGNSYAIITKNLSLPYYQRMRSIPLHEISIQVIRFFIYTIGHQDSTFIVSAIGCGNAGYTPEEIAPMFADAPANVILPDIFLNVLNKAA